MMAVEARMLCGTLFLFLLCCSAQGLDVQGYEGGTVLLPLSSFPEFDGWKDLYLVMVHNGDRDPTRVLKWTTGTVLSTAKIVLPQFEDRMSLIRGPDHPGQPNVVQIRNMTPRDMVTNGYFQFQQPDGAKGQEMDLRVSAITVTASPNPATIGQQVTLTCAVPEDSPDSFSWTHQETAQAVSGTLDTQQHMYTATFTVGPNSAGSYVCKVNGNIGEGQKSIDLHVRSTMETTATTTTTTATTTTPISTSRKTIPDFTTAPSVSSSTAETFSTAKTTDTATATQALGVKPVYPSVSSRESPSFSTEAIIGVLGGLSLVLLIAVVGTCFWKRRKKPRSEESQEQQGMILHHNNECGAGSRIPIDPCQLTLPVQASSLCNSYEEEQNNLNSTRPLLAKPRPKIHTIPISTHADLGSHTTAKSTATQTPVDSPTDDVFHLNEVSGVSTPCSEEATQGSDDNNTNPKAASSGSPINRGRGEGSSASDTDPKTASSARYVHRSTEENSPDINTQRFTDTNRSMSSDESTATEPHSLRSQPRQLNSRNCPQLEDMISYSTGTEPMQNGVSMDPTKRPSVGKSKKLHNPKKATSCATMGTMMEDTIAEDGGGGQVSNREGRRFDVSELRTMSLNGNQVATTIDQMLRKELVDVGNLDIPYSKFSELCLQLYNTHNNWKVLADRLGLTSGDILLIDSCSAQHNLPAAEIVLRHWQRTARHDGTASCNQRTSRHDRTTPCTLQNLRTILQDMGRADLVSMLS